MLLKILAIIVPLLFAFILRESVNHDNLFLQINSRTNSPPKVLFITAHPDDESLFFAPTFVSLQSSNADVFFLCLSAGNADGLGKVRQQELIQSLNVLGIQDGKRWILDNRELRDDIRVKWSPEAVADAVKPYVMGHGINTILTFDGQGISSHPNHISIPHGIIHLLPQLPSPIPKLYTLISLPVFAKYQGPIAPALAKYDLALQKLWQSLYAYVFSPAPSERAKLQIPVFISGFDGYLLALKSMYQHQSQLVWFRWLYVLFSRYMWVNEWLEMEIPVVKPAV